MSRLTMTAAIAMYNGALYVEAQLLSILGQTLMPDQILIIDDGSSDDSLAIVERVRRDSGVDERIQWTIIPAAHRGLAAVMHDLLESASSDIVVICDQDDRCTPDRFERLRMMFAESPEVKAVHTDASIIDSHGVVQPRSLADLQLVTSSERELYARGEAFQVLVRRNIVTGATLAIRKELHQIARPIPECWVWDEWIGISAASLGALVYSPESLIEYRVHQANTIGVTRRTWRDKIEILLASGAKRNARQLARARALHELLARREPRVREDYRARAIDNVRHEEARSRMPAHRLPRLLPVLRHAATGAYSRFGRGRKDVLLDLLQPRARGSSTK